MSPQPKSPPQSETQTTEAPKPPEGYTQVPDVDESITKSIDALLNVAEDLDDEKDKLHARIAANRDMLRGFVTQNLATPEQAGEIVDVYPVRTRKGKDGENGNAAS